MAKRKTQETGISEADYRRAQAVAQAYEKEKAEEARVKARDRNQRVLGVMALLCGGVMAFYYLSGGPARTAATQTAVVRTRTAEVIAQNITDVARAFRTMTPADTSMPTETPTSTETSTPLPTNTTIPTMDPALGENDRLGTLGYFAFQTLTRAASTDTPSPTSTALPTETPVPSSTPLPTNTLTFTPEPSIVDIVTEAFRARSIRSIRNIELSDNRSTGGERMLFVRIFSNAVTDDFVKREAVEMMTVVAQAIDESALDLDSVAVTLYTPQEQEIAVVGVTIAPLMEYYQGRLPPNEMLSLVVYGANIFQQTRVAQPVAPTLRPLPTFLPPTMRPATSRPVQGSMYACNGMDDLNCRDFPNRAAAQQHLLMCGNEDDLDGNEDGQACENSF